MPRKKRKDPAAVSMAKKRWRKLTKTERSAVMTAAVNKRWDNDPDCVRNRPKNGEAA